MGSLSSETPCPGVSTADLEKAVRIVESGGIVAFPTETYYGLAVDPFNSEAVARLFEVKKRSPDKPVLTLIRDKTQLSLLTDDVPNQYYPVMEKFWPGPVTLIFGAVKHLPVQLTGGTGTVGVRIPSHPLALKLLDIARKPLTATSANISGMPAASSAGDVSMQLGNGIDMILDGGRTPGKLGSTIIGCSLDGLGEVRKGIVSFEEILAAVSG